MLTLLLAALATAAPTDAGVIDLGVRIDSPLPGAALSGKWTAVTGHLDLSRYQGVGVVGAERPEFYLPTGHVGLPMVPMLLTKDGAFIAPRVPLKDGANELAAVPMDRHGYVNPVVVKVTAANTNTDPVTLTATPDWGEVPAKVTFKATAAGGASKWEWDFDFKGTFEPGGATLEHTFKNPGTAIALARTEVGGQWRYGLITLRFTGPSKLVHETKAVQKPSRLYVIPAPYLASGERAKPPVRWVLAIDGDAVKVFDPELKPKFTLAGLKAPQGLSVTGTGAIYVADTGHDRIVRFTAEGKLDTTFGEKGALQKVGETKLTSPREVFGGDGDDRGLTVLLADGRLLECSREACEPSSFTLNHPEAKLTRIDVAAEERLDSAGVAMQTPEGWFREVMGVELRPISKLPQVFSGGAFGAAYFLAVDADGALLEFKGAELARRQKPPFAVTALAVDTGSIRTQWEPGKGMGPIHVYLAGKGVIQKRLFDPLDGL